MPTYKFTYFNVRGLGEHIRFIFIAAGVPFEDDKIPTDKWPELKANFKYGQLPILNVDGKELSQSNAIARYLARQYNLVAEDPFLNARADEIADIVTELRLQFRPYIQQQDAGKKAEIKADLAANAFPKYYKFLEDLVSQTTGPFITGDKPTWQDFFVANWLELWSEHIVELDFLNDYPALKELQQAVFDIPAIKKYVSTRPKSFI
jgi:glutathione S-transferase